jgi:hypothetical protein
MAITPNPSVTALPAAPQRLTDTPAAFVSKADALMAAFPTFSTQISAVGAAAQANGTAAETAATSAEAASVAAVSVTGYVRRAANSLTIGTGAKNLTGLNTPSAASFANGDQVSIIDASDDRNRMWGAVSAAVMGSGTMTVTVAGTDFAGSGTLTNWIVVLKSLERLASATAAQVRAGTSSATAVSPASLMAGAAFQTLTWAATQAWDTALGFNARVVLAGTTTMSAPTNLQDGITYTLFIVQDATGSRTVTWNAVFDWGLFGTPVLSTGANKVDIAVGIYSAATGKIHMNFRKAA